MIQAALASLQRASEEHGHAGLALNESQERDVAAWYELEQSLIAEPPH